MPWKALDLMSNRAEFVGLATHPNANVSQLCRRLGISRKTRNKWLSRYRLEGAGGLVDRSRRPDSSPELSRIASWQFAVSTQRGAAGRFVERSSKFRRRARSRRSCVGMG